MPRPKGQRSQAAKRRMENVLSRSITLGQCSSDPVEVEKKGTGFRHKVNIWPVSEHSGLQHQLVIPALSPEKKFVLVIGDSHLRAFADGIVPMTEGNFQFGLMSTPGASAKKLKAEVNHAVVPKKPDAVFVLAPSNNLSLNQTVEKSGAEFSDYLATVCTRWEKVFVIDFVPRLTIAKGYQELLRQEFHRAAHQLGVKYLHIDHLFSLEQLDLWCHDGVHLSDDVGMPRLAEVLFNIAYEQLEARPQKPSVPFRLTPKLYQPKKCRRAKVKEAVPVPTARHSVGTERKKRKFSGDVRHVSTSVKKKKEQQNVDKVHVPAVTLRDCYIPLNPIRFSSDILVAVDKVFPSVLDDQKWEPSSYKVSVPSRVSSKPSLAKKRRLANVRRNISGPSTVDGNNSSGNEEAVPVNNQQECTVNQSRCIKMQKVDSTKSHGSVRVVLEPSCPVEVSACAELMSISPVNCAFGQEKNADQFAVQVAEEDADKQSTQTCTDGKGASLTAFCFCSENCKQAVVSGNVTRKAPCGKNANNLMACSIVSAVKHFITPVCYWEESELEDINEEAEKVMAYLRKQKQDGSKNVDICKAVERCDLFHRKWDVKLSTSVYEPLGQVEGKAVLYDKLQDCLIRDGMCVLELDQAVSLIIQHQQYFVVVDCGVRNTDGLACETGSSVVVYNTCLNDLTLHIENLRKSLGARCFSVSSISVDEREVGSDVRCDVVVPVEDDVVQCTISSSFALVDSVRGTFHQGHSRFKYGGLQCGAISLLALAKHKVDNVFTWQSHTLDEVVVSGDELYTHLRDNNLISAGQERLCVPDLPKKLVVEGHNLECEYGDYMGGEVGVDQGELIDAGVHATLWDGLKTLCTKYETCIFTLGGSTCAIISEGGQYAVVDSHSRSLDGMVDQSGKSVALYFTTIEQLYDYIVHFAEQHQGSRKLFEISGVRIIQTQSVESKQLSDDVQADEEVTQAEFGSSVSEGSNVLLMPCTDSDRREKRKRAFTNTSSKKTKHSDADEVNSDVEFVHDVMSKTLKFNPLSKDVADALCHQLNIESEKLDSVSSENGLLGVPCKTEKIVGDGNCFFRAVSQAISGSQKNHRKIRLAVVKHLQSNPVTYQSLLRDEYSCVSEYVQMSKMQYVGSWATEVEIVATADFLGLDIFTFYNDRWLQYSCKNRPLTNQGLYLVNFHANHYETVVCVQEPNRNVCYGFCKVNMSASQTYNVRHKKLVQPDIDNAVKAVNNCVVEEDCTIILDTADNSELKFNPLCTEVSKTLCKTLNIAYNKQDVEGLSVFGSLGDVCKTDKVIQDGNSFFRAVSKVISGCEDSHRKVRLAVVKFVEKHSEECLKFVGTKYASVLEYIDKTKMKYVGNCATEVDIKMTATALGVHIYVFKAGQWLKYNSNDMVKKDSIYLQCKDNHFVPVICVQHYAQEVCFEFCKRSNDSNRLYMPRRLTPKKKANLEIGESSVNFSKYLQNRKKLKSSIHYQSNAGYKGQKKDILKEMYQLNSLYRENKKVMGKMHYRDNPLTQQNTKDNLKSKYMNDVSFKNQTRQRQKAKYQNDYSCRLKQKQWQKNKYHNDVSFRLKQKNVQNEKYDKDVSFRLKQKNLQKEKYHTDVSYKQKQKHLQKEKYHTDVSYRQKQKEKYIIDVSYRHKQKKYKNTKYHKDAMHREKHKRFCQSKYKSNQMYRQNVKARSANKYHSNNKQKQYLSERVNVKRRLLKEMSENFDFVMEQFLEKVKHGPEFICAVCYRFLFRHQVLTCKKDVYTKNQAVALIADKCISDEYLHRCNHDCLEPCQWLDSARGKLWICYNCHYKINRGEMPAESAINNLGLEPIPSELACLNSLEQHLIALHIPFMKMVALPKGSQRGIHGPVSCVPANLVETCSLLPRSNMEGSLLAVKLKRKLTYKGHYEYQFVDTNHIMNALQYLKQTNVHYKDVDFNVAWTNEFSQETHTELAGQDSNGHTEDAHTDEAEDELLHDRQNHCMFQDTCLMPVDIGQEALDQYLDSTLNLAPGEGNNPVRLLSEKSNEAKCFPVLFPDASKTFHEIRQHRITLSRYFNNRLLHVDGRFARNVDYIFFAQYMSELEQVVSNVSIALRKGQGCMSLNLNDLLKNEQSLRNMLEFDDGYRFLRPIRGTPSFWQSAQRDLLACVRQLGVPTWFCSFSSADMRWSNLLHTILKQEGRTETLEQLEWADRCDLLRRNPVTAARMFDFRWHCFLREVLMSPAHPIGEIVDYYYRVEFQQRGSPHVHALFWVKDAPILDKNTDEEVISFIDRYVTCELPPQDDPLFETVTSVQQHSKRHSKTCRKKNTVCRFNFPRPASCRTFISRGKSYQDEPKTCNCHIDTSDHTSQCTCTKDNKKQMTIEEASNILAAVKKAISDENCNFTCLEQLFQSLHISQSLFEAAYIRCGRNTQIVLKRELDAIWINQYSKPVLKCWSANVDIQFCVDAFAIVVYIISYITKSEREMGLLLGNAHKEAFKEGNLSAKEALKKMGSVYLHNRDVSAQEAVYRLTNMHLKECSRKVMFVPAGDNIVKMSLPLSVLRQRASSQDATTEDMWMTSLVDRYKSRPNNDAFNDMCLATFASEYRVLSKHERCTTAVQLQNGLGSVAKRTRTQPAVIRYVRFSKTKDPEKYYLSMMQLFLPYRLDQELKSSEFVTYEQFYDSGFVIFNNGSRHSVKSVVDGNKSMYETEAEQLDIAEKEAVVGADLEDAWCQLCPEQQVERLECLKEVSQTENFVEGTDENIPELSVTREQVAHLEKKNNILSRNEGLALIRSLNVKQLSVFYQVRRWCLDKIQGKNPEPLHVFITGGAGTGKSHLVRAIQYESMRLLSQICRHPDSICVLCTAPTGIAAYNLQATTIHSTFSIGKDVRLPYTPLGEEKLNSLRVLYSDLQLLVIDEISMVDINLLSYIHGRLRQIKQTGDFSPFGNVSIVAVGDFFQLPPVRGKPLYVDDVPSNLWNGLFKVVELTDIVRQKDQVFASLLNRVRTHSKGTAMLKNDVEILKRCETGEVSSALHIFATNLQVNEHNICKLSEICPDYDVIHAQDFVNDKKTGNLKELEGHHAKAPHTCLPEVLMIGKNARVMLCKNIDVADGLVNGVCGIVTSVVFSTNSKFPKKVFVTFDNAHVGSQRRRKSQGVSTDLVGSTSIDPEEERATSKGGLRRQFPLKLAWACTIHKVQGITVDEAVVSLRKIFSAGQAYVALSRVRNMSGLIIQDFDEKKMYCKDNIKAAINTMPPFLIDQFPMQTLHTPSFDVFLMNVQSLSTHVMDLAACTQHLQLNCIAVTETWLSEAGSPENMQIAGYNFFNCPRSTSYNNTNSSLVTLQDQQHGGVGVYSAENVAFNILHLPHVNLECVVHDFIDYKILLAVIYRPPSYPVTLFKVNLGKLLDWLDPLSNTVAVMGDFNDDILKSSTINQFFSNRGYTQVVTEATTEKGTLIDHVYVKTEWFCVEATVVPTYFSDHEGILCRFS